MCLAIPVQVVAAEPDGEWASVDLGGVRKRISVALLEDVQPGEYVILHVGYALAKLDTAEAERTLALIASGVPSQAAP